MMQVVYADEVELPLSPFQGPSTPEEFEGYIFVIEEISKQNGLQNAFLAVKSNIVGNINSWKMCANLQNEFERIK